MAETTLAAVRRRLRAQPRMPQRRSQALAREGGGASRGSVDVGVPSRPPLGRLLGLFDPAASGIESGQERQIVRPISDLDVFLPEIGHYQERL